MPMPIEDLKQFRQEVYEFFPIRSDALMDLLDSLSSNTTARSIVELSLSSLFRREYSSVYDGIENFFQGSESERRVFEQNILRLIAKYLPEPEQRKFWLFAIDVTPAPRPFSKTLEDRTFVHQPNSIGGNKPVTIGHQYSFLVFLPEKSDNGSVKWVVPLIVRRIRSNETPNIVAAEQIESLMTDSSLPFHNQLVVDALDSAYSVAPFLGRTGCQENLVTITRSRGNRTFYRTPPPVLGIRGKGHPTWYGEPFSLKNADTWGKPDQVEQTTFTSRSGKTYTVYLEGWNDLLMRGKRDLPMHNYPFTLIRARLLDADGKEVFKHPLWLIVSGSRRGELSLIECWEAYRQRYDIEHYFRFGKQRLLITASQTPEVEREENWWQIAQLAYIQLWLARQIAENLPRPWERYLPKNDSEVASPSVTQRDFGRVVTTVETPAQAPKQRGRSNGRAKGAQGTKRDRQPVIKKGKTQKNSKNTSTQPRAASAGGIG